MYEQSGRAEAKMCIFAIFLCRHIKKYRYLVENKYLVNGSIERYRQGQPVLPE
jgi:hypothetical protein